MLLPPHKCTPGPAISITGSFPSFLSWIESGHWPLHTLLALPQIFFIRPLLSSKATHWVSHHWIKSKLHVDFALEILPKITQLCLNTRSIFHYVLICSHHAFLVCCSPGCPVNTYIPQTEFLIKLPHSPLCLTDSYSSWKWTHLLHEAWPDQLSLCIQISFGKHIIQLRIR